MKKHFNFAELLERIKVQFRISKGSKERLELGPLAMDVTSHQVFVDEQEIHLTLKEFQLLEFLVRNKEQVCTRTKILEKVWDIRFDYESGVIDVNINAIRKKIGHQLGEQLIQTIRGVGYIAKEP